MTHEPPPIVEHEPYAATRRRSAGRHQFGNPLFIIASAVACILVVAILVVIGNRGGIGTAANAPGDAPGAAAPPPVPGDPAPGPPKAGGAVGSGMLDESRIRIENARWEPAWHSDLGTEMLVFRVTMDATNHSRRALGDLYFKARLIIPGRSIAHGESMAHAEIPSGIEPGETRRVSISIPAIMVGGGEFPDQIMPDGCRLEIAELDYGGEEPRVGEFIPVPREKKNG